MQLLSLNEAASQLSVSNMTVRRLVKTGQLQHIRVGRCIRCIASDVDKLIATRVTRGQ